MYEKGHGLKSLVVYYSRTGTTRKVAEEISKDLKSEIEEIVDTENRSGVIGWIKTGREAGKKTLAKIESPKKDPASYDVVIIGTPIWNHTFSAPIRTYITQYKNRFKKVAFFRTGDSIDDDPFDEMESTCGKKPVAKLKLHRKSEVEVNRYEDKVKEFIDKITADTSDAVTKRFKS